MTRKPRIIVTGHVLNPLDWTKFNDIPCGAICYDDHGKIVALGARDEVLGTYPPHQHCELIDFAEFMMIPTFTDVHLHAPQFNCRGIYSDDLLNWLENFIFAEEEKFANLNYAAEVARKLYKEMLRFGIGTASIFGSVHAEAADILLSKGAETSMKLAIGKAMMDRSKYENTHESLTQSIRLFKKWDGKNGGRLRYSFAPRFGPSCTEVLLKEVGSFITQRNALCQTHLSENLGELELVKKLFSDYNSYTDVYAANGLLKKGSIVAHAIHLDGREFNILKNSGCGVAHCPDSNMFLNSGKMDFGRMKEKEIAVGLGSDIGAGSTLSPFNSMKMMIYSHRDINIRPETALFLATLGGAKIIGFGDITGNFEIGKDADFIVIRKPKQIPGLQVENTRQILSHLIFCNGENHIHAVYLRGKRVF